jgi:hypothetical protein
MQSNHAAQTASFMELAKEAKAVYHIRRIVLVNTEKLDEYIEVMYSDDPE